MSFDCPQYYDGYCHKKNGKCIPAKGNCILSGSFKQAREIDGEKKGINAEEDE